MNSGNSGNVAIKTNIITLNKYRPIKQKPPSPKQIEKAQDDEVINAFHDACIKITDKIDIKGYALVAKAHGCILCLSWSTGHNKNPISEMLLPTFTQSCFQGILNKKLSTTEDLNE